MLSFVGGCGFGALLEGNSKAPIETSEFNTNPNNSLPETQTSIFDLFDREGELTFSWSSMTKPDHTKILKEINEIL